MVFTRMKSWLLNLFSFVLLLGAVRICGAMRRCRDRDGISLSSNVYNGWTCAKCYEFLYPHKNIVAKFPFYLIGKDNMTSLHPGTVKTMHVRRSRDRRKVCRSLTSDQCLRWLSCCKAAADCCVEQQQTTNGCPATWDGYSCWNGVERGAVSFLSCPDFIPFSLPNQWAVKDCGDNGNWARKGNLEITDYSACMNKEKHRHSVYAALSFNSLSSLLLIIAFLLFLLKSDIKISKTFVFANLYIGVLLYHCSCILWEWFVVYDRLSTKSLRSTQLHQNSIGCKMIWILKVYFRTVTFTWLLANTVFFDRFISHDYTFTQPVIRYYILAWGFPVATVGVQAGLRVMYKDNSCWSEDFGVYKWVECAPNILCLVITFLLLINSIRMLFSKSSTQRSSEPEFVRRSCILRFLLFLVFVVQSTMSVVKLPPSAHLYITYETFASFINNTLGIYVAVALCFLDSRVTSCIRYLCTGKPTPVKLMVEKEPPVNQC